MKERRRRILFFGEAVSLAHVSRPYVLARGLDPERYEVVLATASRYNTLLDTSTLSLREIASIPTSRFLEALKKGQPIYDTATLHGYVNEDLQVIREFDPDVVVGDFRLSLDISAKLSNKPYIALTNGYWSPYAKVRYPVPDIPLVNVLGVKLGQRVFDLAYPLVSALHAVPMNKARRHFGLPNIKYDARDVYTHGDYTAYADLPELVPMGSLPNNHRFIGPIIWSPTIQLPAWWGDIPSDRPVVYATPGSSGETNLVPIVLEALADLPVYVIAATAGRTQSLKLPDNARVGDFLPGSEAAARAKVVVCNGGSPTTYQALAAGVPVVGVPSNLDQYLNMSLVERTGSGLLVRAGCASVKALRESVAKILSTPGFSVQAATLKDSIRQTNTQERFEALLMEAANASHG